MYLIKWPVIVFQTWYKWWRSKEANISESQFWSVRKYQIWHHQLPQSLYRNPENHSEFSHPNFEINISHQRRDKGICLNQFSPHCLPGSNPPGYGAASLHPSVGGHSAEEQRCPASTGRRPGLPAQPQWSQKLRHPQWRVSMKRNVSLHAKCPETVDLNQNQIKSCLFFFSTNIGGFFHSVRDSTETKKIQMDPTRETANPYVGLAFKLEVIQFDREHLFCLMSSWSLYFCTFVQ